MLLWQYQQYYRLEVPNTSCREIIILETGNSKSCQMEFSNAKSIFSEQTAATEKSYRHYKTNVMGIKSEFQNNHPIVKLHIFKRTCTVWYSTYCTDHKFVVLVGFFLKEWPFFGWWSWNRYFFQVLSCLGRVYIIKSALAAEC